MDEIIWTKAQLDIIEEILGVDNMPRLFNRVFKINDYCPVCKEVQRFERTYHSDAVRGIDAPIVMPTDECPVCEKEPHMWTTEQYLDWELNTPNDQE